MNKQRMSNILSSVQMNPRDRKDFIEELSKLGQGGQGGEVSGEHPVRIIELTEEEMMTGKKLDITIEEYLKYKYIIVSSFNELKLKFNYTYMYEYFDMGSTYFEDVYVLNNKNTSAPSKIVATIQYRPYNIKDTINILPIRFIDIYGDINFNLCTTPKYNLQMLASISSSKSYSVILFKDGSTIHGNYYNGTFTAFVEGKLKQYNVNTQTGEITEGISIDINALAGLEARIAALEGA